MISHHLGVWTLLAVYVSPCLARFTVNGPVLTITLKDPNATSESANKWVDMSALRPNAHWSVQSWGQPLPNWIPSLRSLRASIGYNHADFSALPSTVDAEFRFAREGLGELDIHPSYHLKQRQSSCLIQATKGNTANVFAQLSFGGKRMLEILRGNFMVNLPFSSSLSALKVSPAFDFLHNSPSCTLEGITGSGRTKAILNLQYNDPTLSVVHAIDSR